MAIAVAAVLGVIYTSRGSAPTAQIAAILSGGFTAIGTMTTAYFGIKSISNTAASLAGPPTGRPTGGEVAAHSGPSDQSESGNSNS